MVTPDTPADLLDVVALRHDLLTALGPAPLTKREVVERVDVSRSTVDRGLQDLRSAGLAAERANGYVVTVAGRLARRTYQQALETVADLQRAKPALSVLPPDAPVDPAFLDGCEVVSAEPPVPQRPAARMSEYVREADRIRGLGRAHTSPEANELLRERVDADDTDVSFVLERALFEYLVDDIGWDDAAEADGPVDAVVDSLPYGLFLFAEGGAERACLLAYDDDGEQTSLRALLVNDTPESVAWAESVFERYRERGVRPERELGSAGD